MTTNIASPGSLSHPRPSRPKNSITWFTAPNWLLKQESEHDGGGDIGDDVGRHGHRPEEAEFPDHSEQGEGEDQAKDRPEDEGAEHEHRSSVQRVPELGPGEHAV